MNINSMEAVPGTDDQLKISTLNEKYCIKEDLYNYAPFLR